MHSVVKVFSAAAIRVWIHACISHTGPVLSVLHNNNATEKTEI